MIGKILVIEDEPGWQRQIHRALKAYDLQTASNIEKARQLLDQALAQNHPFQVVTLDISLKADHTSPLDTSGEQLLNYIKIRHPYLKCVVVSGTADIDQASNYLSRFGVLKCFSKRNFDAEQFRAFVDSIFYLGQYRLLKKIGHGGMGEVYAAQGPHSKTWVALKVLNYPNDLGDKQRWLFRFRREAETMRSLSHNHIVTVFDYVVGAGDEDPSYIVMEYLDGPTLADLLKRQGRLPVEQVVDIGTQLFDALTYAHQRHTIHRDIKPSNLILVDGHYLKVTDFGIAKVLDHDQQLTLTREVLGTFGYMPPEQMDSARQADHRSDIYAAGVVLYQALTGSLPYENLWMSSPRPLAAHGLEVHNLLETILLKTLAINPEDRYQSAETVRDLLASKERLL